jgi:hypothetical protein
MHTCMHACIIAPGKGWVSRETDRLYKAPTFVTFVSGLALRAWLVSIIALVIIAGAADRECTFIASYKELTLGGQANIIPTDLTNVAIDMLQRFWLQHHPQTRQTKQNKQRKTGCHFMLCQIMSCLHPTWWLSVSVRATTIQLWVITNFVAPVGGWHQTYCCHGVHVEREREKERWGRRECRWLTPSFSGLITTSSFLLWEPATKPAFASMAAAAHG